MITNNDKGNSRSNYLNEIIHDRGGHICGNKNITSRFMKIPSVLAASWRNFILNKYNLLPNVVSKIAEWVANSDTLMRHNIFTWVYTVCSGLSCQGTVKYYTYGTSHAETTGKLMTKSSVITNQLSITMAGLIIMIIIFLALISQPYAQHICKKICAKHTRICAQHILEYCSTYTKVISMCIVQNICQ